MTDRTDVAVIGAGPAGLAAAIRAAQCGARVLLIERESAVGGILKQCIHDGFGLIRFGERLSGPEYAGRFSDALPSLPIEVHTRTFVTAAVRLPDGAFSVTVTSPDGLFTFTTRSIVLATGCRERTARQVGIHGTRPSGVYTAGAAQFYVNRLGCLPTRRCVILGSGDIGLIMARRLTLEGAKVLGVYEVLPEPSGLTRNIAQCLDDFNIPLHLSHTVTRVFGDRRLEAVEICRVDENRQPVWETAERIACDALILSVGLIPENELAEMLGVPLDPLTGGAIADNRFMTGVPGVYACGNCLHVSDLVDYVSESGELAGAAAAVGITKPPRYARVAPGKQVRYAVPQRIDLNTALSDVVFYFRVSRTLRDAVCTVAVDGRTVLTKRYSVLRPPEMVRLTLDCTQYGLSDDSVVTLSVEETEANA